MCPACDNPETTLNPNQKKQIITQRCKACGNSGLLDMRHKLTTFIMKNPPDAPLDGSEVVRACDVEMCDLTNHFTHDYEFQVLAVASNLCTIPRLE